jgi:hypothetical protein
VLSDDKSNMQITVEGMDFLAANKPSPEEVMACIKPAAVAVSQAQPAPEKAPELSTLNRALAGTSV